MTAVHHKLDVYGADLYLCRSVKEWRKLRRTVDSLGDDPTSQGATSIDVNPTNGEYAVTIYVHPGLTDEAERVECVAHEAAHAARMILDHVGETGRTWETEPYLVGWIAGWVWRHLG
ncbi:hypothetical protein [Auraticoccus monumenti]|uniref:Uncharacterized protein n=1 Tax=Auraticoccus monumenti TaxID=675864 RepID=A0A1G6UM66_9ACTN|nr:hypothetical protein [Auraticoccus monumenti]SDD41625.1 hypothetical protein SAMN04489747_0904 [Auraticoccus monumenti]